MKTKLNYCNADKCYFCTDNAEVKEGKVIAQDITLQDETCIILLTIESEGEQYKVVASACYTSVEDYRANKPAELREIRLNSVKGVSDAGEKPMYYTIENGQVVTRIIDRLTIHIDCVKPRWAYTCTSIPDGVQAYKNPSVAEQMCRTEWTDENGQKHVKDGLLSLILLDDEQKAALKALRDAFKHCEELEMGIGFHTDSCALYAWNKRNVEKAEFMYYNDEGEEALVFEDEVIDNFLTDMYPDYIGCDDTMRVVRKDEKKAEDETK